MHVLWISDSPDTPSGFGNVTRFVCGGLARRGHRVSILGWQTRQAGVWNGCHVFPTGVDPMGSDALFGLLVRYRPEVVVALGDVWWLPYFSAPHVRRQMELLDAPWLLYFPIDGDTDDERLPPSWIELLSQVDVPIAMSRFGQRIAANCGVECEYIPHGVDLDVFAPPEDRDLAKQRVEAAGRFLVLSDSRNQPRKLLPRVLDVFARFARGKPDALLHLHTDPDDEFTRSGYYSYDVRADVKHHGLESQVRFSRPFTIERGGGLPLAELASLYQAADVHLLASSGEGFGLPTLQAAAAGAVPMAGAYSASRELVEGHGEALTIADWTQTQFGIRRAYIDVEDAAGRLERLFADRALLRHRSAQSRQFAQQYGWELIVDQWDRLIRRIGHRRQRITRSLARPVATTASTTSPFRLNVPDVNITVKVVQRELGRLEAALMADSRQHHASDVRLPVLPPPCQVANLRVERQPAYVGMAPEDEPIFSSLQRIFPDLVSWTPWRALGHERYELAQSTLLLNVALQLSDDLLIDAALFGVPCVGSASPVQAALWPGVIAHDAGEATGLARAVLTNAGMLERIVTDARRTCLATFAPDEAEAAAALRRSHVIRQSEPVGVRR